MIDIIFVASIAVLVALLAATSYIASEYSKELRKAQREYEKAKESVEEIVISFNRELKRESDRIEAISFRVEGTTVQAESGLRKIGEVERRVTSIEVNFNQVKTDIDNLVSGIASFSEINTKMLEKVSNFDFGTVDEKLQSFQVALEKKGADADSKLQEVEEMKTALTSKLAILEEQLQRLAVSPVITADLSVPTPVIPIKRDKAMASLTETEIAVLEFLVAEGSKTAPEIKEKVQLSREHTARLMKKLYEEGYLERETRKLPFTYNVKKEMEKLLRKTEPTSL